MANFEILNFTHTWILGKYSKQIRNDQNKFEWQNLDSSSFINPINLSLTPTNFLLVRHENEIHEFMNLCTNKSNLKAFYQGNSLLIIFKIKDVMRKFRVQFSDSNLKSSQSNCLACVKELSRFIDVIEFGSDISFENRYFSVQKPKNKVDTLELSQMTDLLVKKNEKKLPLIYQQESEVDILNSEDDKVLQEFIICCLIDPMFPSFVKKFNYY
ncbi:meiotic recombination REC114-like protein [Brachionus plicatilis]|uniref:Meiotic recombination REC114-like protein n=1 Tax=Brachionus plicatilis TaxID=10195 RepID=A0A3M7Q0Z7_BRAPC|nr:meiotic recombination REC114-like protein [Brachionus plicatilis]